MFQYFATFPLELEQHVMVKIDSTSFVAFGGKLETNKIHHFDTTTQLWSEWPILPQTSSLNQGGIVTYLDGTKHLVVAGGNIGAKIGAKSEISSTFIMSLETMTWRAGPDLPQPRREGVSVQFQDTFLIVGGISSGDANYQNDIYQFNSNLEIWTKRAEKLITKRANFAAFFIPQEIAQCF